MRARILHTMLMSSVIALMAAPVASPSALLGPPPPRRAAVRRSNRSPSKYMPHQGKRECARRMRQLAAGQIR